MIRTYVGQPPVKVMGDTVAVPPGTVMRFGVHKTLWRVSHHPLVLLVDPAAADRAATVQTAAALGAHVAAAHDAAGGAPCTHVLVPATGEVVTDSAVLTSVITGRPTVPVPCQCWLLHIRVCRQRAPREQNAAREEGQGTWRPANKSSNHQSDEMNTKGSRADPPGVGSCETVFLNNSEDYSI